MKKRKGFGQLKYPQNKKELKKVIESFISAMGVDFFYKNLAAYIRDLNEKGYMRIEMSEALIHFYNKDFDYAKWEEAVWVSENNLLNMSGLDNLKLVLRSYDPNLGFIVSVQFEELTKRYGGKLIAANLFVPYD